MPTAASSSAVAPNPSIMPSAGIFQHFAQAVDLLGPISRLLPAVAGEVAQLANLGRRNETGLQQPAFEQLR